jgi:hypothetical protein
MQDHGDRFRRSLKGTGIDFPYPAQVFCSSHVSLGLVRCSEARTNGLPRGSHVNKLIDATRSRERGETPGALCSDRQFPLVNNELVPGVVLPTVDGPIPLAERRKICVAGEVPLDVREIHRIGLFNCLFID